jgi:hypothetical protein
MKKYTAEFHARNDYGTQIATADTLQELFSQLEIRGCKPNPHYVEEVSEWEKIAEDGDKYYGDTFTLRKGKSRMTEYTSL